MNKLKKQPALWVWQYLVLLVSITLFTSLLAIVMMYFTGKDSAEHAKYSQALIISGTFTFVFLSFCIPTWHFLTRFFPLTGIKNLLVHAGSVALVSVAAFLAGNVLITTILYHLTGYLWTDEDTVMSAFISLIGVVTVNAFYYINHLYRRSVQSQKDTVEAQIAALKAQINPHFLFNSLNSIAALVRIAPEKAETVTEDLAELFRYSLASGKTERVSLQEELAITEVYLNIEKARFGDRLRYEKQVDEDALSWQVPSLLLQPLIENAVKHGVGRSDTPVTIRLTVRKLPATGKKSGTDTHPTESGRVKNNHILLTVTHDGRPYDSTDLTTLMGRGVGLGNVYRRLVNHYGDTFGITLTHTGIELEIPA